MSTLPLSKKCSDCSQDVLQDPKVLNYGYYINEPLPPDTFKNISIMEQRLAEIGLLHMCTYEESSVISRLTFVATAVKVHGDYRTWVDDEGVQRKLYPKITPEGDEIYLVASFHTMHCLV